MTTEKVLKKPKNHTLDLLLKLPTVRMCPSCHKSNDIHVLFNLTNGRTLLVIGKPDNISKTIVGGLTKLLEWFVEERTVSELLTVFHTIWKDSSYSFDYTMDECFRISTAEITSQKHKQYLREQHSLKEQLKELGLKKRNTPSFKLKRYREDLLRTAIAKSMKQRPSFPLKAKRNKKNAYREHRGSKGQIHPRLS